MNVRRKFAAWTTLFGLLCNLIGQAGEEGNHPISEAQYTRIGDHRMYFHCQGPTNQTPLVLFESGGGGTSKDWEKVRSFLPASVRTCVYDRAGLGKSEPGPAPRTLRQEVFELHALLEAAKLTGPMVLVSQSLGGLLHRLYVENYGSNVVGMVLIDPTDESGILANVRYGGWVRLREKATARAIPEARLHGRIPTQEFKPGDDFLAEEFQQIHISRQTNPQPLGDRPLIVVGAGKRPQPPGVISEEWAQRRLERDEQVRAQASLSRNSKFLLDPESGHGIHNENPQLVAKAIEEILAALAKGKRLDATSHPDPR